MSWFAVHLTRNKIKLKNLYLNVNGLNKACVVLSFLTSLKFLFLVKSFEIAKNCALYNIIFLEYMLRRDAVISKFFTLAFVIPECLVNYVLL